MSPADEHTSEDQMKLLLYLADELPALERAQLQQRLDHDAQLRRMLEGLEQVQRSVDTAIRDEDEAERVTVSFSTKRRFSQALRRWHGERLREDARQERSSSRRAWVRKLYPVAAAAAILLGYTAWWGFQAEPDAFVTTRPTNPETPGARAARYRSMIQGYWAELHEENAELAGVEAELDDLFMLRRITEPTEGL